ncbi:SF0329 family protein [Paenibacillus vini]|uniref:Uncharacterized protein n=1 Tax=Paenibacillus vini TaxID=1476024 RepID=A0ABQ4MB89_9BACL|nr:hypothetical protein [Paenibacillus vini]GIP53252.1 hypothetical protein J42TS3_22870 [Paenibacillus vini]
MIIRWSRMKKQLESRLCDSLKGRVSYNNTRYRGTHDQEGRAWVTFDNVIIHDFCTINREYKFNTLAYNIRSENDCLDYRKPEQKDGYWKAYREADQEMINQGIYSQYEFYNAVQDYLNLSIEDGISSEDPIIRAISMFDYRFGRRRLLEIEADTDFVVNKFLKIRLEAEGLFKDEGSFA